MDNKTAFKDDLYKQIRGQHEKIEFIQPETLTKFPQFRNTYANIADEVVMKHVFPKGFFLEYNVVTPSHHVLFFSLDNYPFNTLGKKIYYVALIFYESLLDYYNIKIAYDNFDINNEKENESGKDQQSASDKDDEIRNHLKNFHVPKAICLASFLPFPFEESNILKSLCKAYSLNKISSIDQIEKIIEKLVLTIPYPPRGQYHFEFKIFNDNFIFSQTPINKVPNSSIVLPLMFAKFKVEEILKIFKCILLELPILFFSNDSLTLSTICEGFLSLLYPFRYQWAHVSILPVNNYSLIEICDSFFFGINEEYNISFFEKYSIEQETKTIYAADIEKGEIHQLKPNLNKKQNIILGQAVDPFIETHNLYEQVDLPSHYRKKFQSRLISSIQKMKDKKTSIEKKIDFNPKIRDDFFYFFVSILIDYGKYLKILVPDSKKAQKEKDLLKQRKNFTIEEIFSVNEYTLSMGSVEQIFYKRLLNTKMFKEFIMRKMNPITFEDKMEILYFDERIVKKRNKHFFTRTIKTPLIDSNEFEKQSAIEISQRKSFSNAELIFLSQKENQKNALNYYQQIIVKEQGTEIEIKNLVFPKLLYDNEFFKKTYLTIYNNNNLPPGNNYRAMSEVKMQSILNQTNYCDIYKDSGYSFGKSYFFIFS